MIFAQSIRKDRYIIIAIVTTVSAIAIRR
jgi:hypothetical protein